jgi:hypothetical protein
MRNPGLLISWLALSLPASSFAESATRTVRVALHASEVVDATAADAAQIHALVVSEIARRGANLAGSEDVAAFLSSRADRSCAALSDSERIRCLGELARGLGADRSVLVTIAPYAGERIILTALVVSSAGKVLQEIQPSTYPRGLKRALQESVRAALGDFVPSLAVFEAPPGEPAPPLISHGAPPDGAAATGPTATVEPASASARKNASSPPALQRAPAKPGSDRRTTGIVIAATGLLIASGGGIFLGEATAKAAEFNQAYGAGRPGMDQESYLASLRAEATRSQAIGLAGIGVGAAAVIGGALLLFTREEARAAASDVQWLIGPGSLAVRLPLP